MASLSTNQVHDPEVELSKQEDTLPDAEVELSMQEDTLPDAEVELSKLEDTLSDPEVELSKQEDTLPDPEVELSKQEDTLPDPEMELSKQEDTLTDPEMELSKQEERPRKRMDKWKVETKLEVEDLKHYSINYAHPQRQTEKAPLLCGEKTTELEQDNIRERVQRRMDVEKHGDSERELHERYEEHRDALERQLEEKHREEVQQLRLQLEEREREREEEERSRMEWWIKEREILEKHNKEMKVKEEEWREREEEMRQQIMEQKEELSRREEELSIKTEKQVPQRSWWGLFNSFNPFGARAVSPPPQTESGLRLVLLGESWASNRSAGYTILGRSCTVKRKSLMMKGRVCGRQVTLVESLGWKMHSEQRYVQQEVQRAVSLCRPAPHAFILVIPLYFTESYCRALQESLECLSDRVWGKTIVLFTFGDWQLGDTPIEQHIERQGRALQEIMEKCGNRFHVFRDENNVTQVKELLEKVEAIAAGNSSSCYENSMDLSGKSQEWDDGEQKAQRQMEKLRERQLREEQNCARRWQGRILRYEQSVRAHEGRRRNIETLMGDKKAHELVRELERELMKEDQVREGLERELERLREEQGKEEEQIKDRHLEEVKILRESCQDIKEEIEREIEKREREMERLREKCNEMKKEAEKMEREMEKLRRSEEEEKRLKCTLQLSKEFVKKPNSCRSGS